MKRRHHQRSPRQREVHRLRPHLKDLHAGLPHEEGGEEHRASPKAAFVTAFNRLVTERAGANIASRSCASTSASCASEEIAANARLVRQTLCDTTELEREKASLGQESLKGLAKASLAVLVEMTQNCIAENARIAQDQGEYQISSEPQDFPACESLMHSKRYNLISQ